MGRSQRDAEGFFYLIQLQPEEAPGRIKLGWTCDLERRLHRHRQQRNCPDAEITMSWPCLFGWEQHAITAATRRYCQHLRGEEYKTVDMPGTVALASLFFAEANRGGERETFPVHPPRPKVKVTVPVLMEERLLTVKEVAERMHVDEETVRRWLRNGRLRGYRPGGERASYRIPASEVERLLTAPPPAPDAP